MEKNIITGTWDNVKLVCCQRHKEPVPMVIQDGPSSPFYACPKYHPENREEGEFACNNRLSVQDFSKMLEHLHQIIIASEMRDEKVNLTHYEWKDRKGIEYKVLSHTGDKLVISVYNKRAMRS